MSGASLPRSQPLFGLPSPLGVTPNREGTILGVSATHQASATAPGAGSQTLFVRGPLKRKISFPPEAIETSSIFCAEVGILICQSLEVKTAAVLPFRTTNISPRQSCLPTT